MTRFVWSLVAIAALPTLPALAAPPTAFRAMGTALSFATPDAPEQSTPVTFYYQGGNIRLDMHPAGSPASVVLAKRGSKRLTMLDPSQKIAFTTVAAKMEGAEGMPALDEMLDMASWKSQLAKGAKRLPGSEVKGAQKCSIWEKTQGANKFKIWFADALELPMQIEGAMGGKPRFRFTVSRVVPGRQPLSLFLVPAGYQKADFNPNTAMKH